MKMNRVNEMNEMEIARIYEDEIKENITHLAEQSMESVVEYVEKQVKLIEKRDLVLPYWLASKILLKNMLEFIINHIPISRVSGELERTVRKLSNLYLRISLEVDLLKAGEYVKILNLRYVKREKLPDTIELKENVEDELKRLGILEYRLSDEMNSLLRLIGKEISDLNVIVRSGHILKRLMEKGLIRVLIVPKEIDILMLAKGYKERKAPTKTIEPQLIKRLLEAILRIGHIKELYGDELEEVLNILGRASVIEGEVKEETTTAKVEKGVKEIVEGALKINFSDGTIEIIGKRGAISEDLEEYLRHGGYDLVYEEDLVKFKKKVDNVDSLLNDLSSLRGNITVKADEKSPSWFKALVNDPNLAEFLRKLRSKIIKEIDGNNPIPNVKVWEVAISLGYTYEDTYKYIGKLVREGLLGIYMEKRRVHYILRDPLKMT
ncbi:MAG: hypothetical protein DRZ82_03850 [Thermoprotei archaeon]|nr:MAG: hypothetical protein DRZ82_03850 [Thermoprotei archaeon]